MGALLLHLAAQDAPLRTLADALLVRQARAEPGPDMGAGQVGEALVEGAEVCDAFLVLGGDEGAQHHVVIDHAIEPPAAVVRLEGVPQILDGNASVFQGVDQRRQPLHQRVVPRPSPRAPAVKLRFQRWNPSGGGGDAAWRLAGDGVDLSFAGAGQPCKGLERSVVPIQRVAEGLSGRLHGAARGQQGVAIADQTVQRCLDGRKFVRCRCKPPDDGRERGLESQRRLYVRCACPQAVPQTARDRAKIVELLDLSFQHANVAQALEVVGQYGTAAALGERAEAILAPGRHCQRRRQHRLEGEQGLYGLDIGIQTSPDRPTICDGRRQCLEVAGDGPQCGEPIEIGGDVGFAAAVGCRHQEFHNRLRPHPAQRPH